MKIPHLEITEHFGGEKKPSSLIIRRIETQKTVSTLHTSGPRVKNVNIIHKWLKCKKYTLLVKRLLMSTLCTSG
jgi:hypothetical protein